MNISRKFHLFKHRSVKPKKSLKDKINQAKFSIQKEKGEERKNETTPLLSEEKKKNSSTEIEGLTRQIGHELPTEGVTKKKFEGFENKKTLKVGLICTSLYYLVTLIGCRYFFESWSVIDSLYFATVVLTTVGYGDLFPSAPGSRFFVIFLVIYSVTILGFFVSLLADFLAKYNEKSMDDALKNSHVLWLQELNEIFEKNESAEIDADEGTTTSDSCPIKDTIRDHHTELHKKERSIIIDILREMLEHLPMLLLIVGIMMIIAHIENWTIVEGFYWLIVTGTTVGFGDYDPTHESTKLICIFYIPLCVVVLGDYITSIVVIFIDRKQKMHEQNFLFDRKLSAQDLKAWDKNNDNKVSKYEFLIFALKKMGKLDDDDLEAISKAFTNLDTTNSGYLTANDII